MDLGFKVALRLKYLENQILNLIYRGEINISVRNDSNSSIQCNGIIHPVLQLQVEVGGRTREY